MPAEQFQAYHLLVVSEIKVQEVCDLLSMNANRVYKAKSKCLARVRAHLLEFDATIGD